MKSESIQSCFLSSKLYSLQLGDLILLEYKDPKRNRLAAWSKQYYMERQFLPHLPHIILCKENVFTYLGIELINVFTCCKWLAGDQIWYTCLHPNVGQYLTVEKLIEN